MIKIILNKIKVFVFFIFLFLFYWFLNSGFLIDPSWLIIQAIFFTIMSRLIFINQKISLSHWFLFIALLYFVSAILEIFNIAVFPEIASSSGFGVLVILVVSRLFVNKELL